MTDEVFYYHGGRPGLRPGDTITADLTGRPLLDDCPFCAARNHQAATGTPTLIDPLPAHPDRVYATTNRLYAKHYASLWGRGDLYRVVPIDQPIRSDEDTIPTWHAEAWKIASVYDRAVDLTWSERRKLWKQWTEADRAADAAAAQGAQP